MKLCEHMNAVHDKDTHRAVLCNTSYKDNLSTHIRLWFMKKIHISPAVLNIMPGSK